MVLITTLVFLLLGCFAFTYQFGVDAMQPLINPSPFVRFALSVLVARSGTLLSRVLAIISGVLATALVPRLLTVVDCCLP